MPNQFENYQYPAQIVETNTVVDVYAEFPTVEDLYEEVGEPSEPTVQEVVNNYNIDNSVEINVYPNGEPAPSTGISVFQKVFNVAQQFLGTAEELAQLYASAQAISAASGALINGAGPIYTACTALIGESGAYTLGTVLSAAPEAAVAAIAAVAGYKIGNAVFDAVEDYPWMQDILETAADWIATDDGFLAGIYRGILGIQYGNKTYLDSRLYDAIKEKLSTIVPDYESFFYHHDILTQSNFKVGVYDISTTSRVINLYLTGSGFYQSIKYDFILDCELDIESTNGCQVSVWSRKKFDTTRDYNTEIYLLIHNPNNSSIRVTLTFKVLSSIYTNLSSGTVAVRTINVGANRYYNYHFADVIAAHHVSGSTTYPLYDCYNIKQNYILLGYLESITTFGDLEDAELPEGLEPWTGDSVPDPSVNQIHVVVDTNTSSTIPYYPVALPNTQPSTVNNYYTLDPETQPNPTIIYLPSEQIYPYTVPSPILPQDDPVSLPDVDPSVAPNVEVPSELPLPDISVDEGDAPNIDIPVVAPPFDVSGAGDGLFNVYNPTAQELYDFCNWLWVKWTDASLSKIINNPFDGIISLHELYATPATTTAQAITSGFLKSDVTAALVNQRYTTINCGTIAIPEYFRNYLDYSPYTKAHVFLPFIGIVELNADDISGHAVNITYHIDSYSGACVAIITVARNDGQGHVYSAPQYQFNGSCSVPLPISGGSQANLTAGLWLAGSSAVGSIVNGIVGAVNNPTHAASNVWNGISGAISDVSATLLTRKSEVQHSGNMIGNFGAMTGKKPYIIMKRPRQVVAQNYNADYGYPAHRRVTLGALSGYTRVKEVNVISATATNDEKAQIETLLKRGVYMT